MADDPNVFDLGHARAARLEGGGRTKQLRLNGELVAELPPELPIDVFSPLQEVDTDLSMLAHGIRSILTAQGDQQQQGQALDLLVDLMVATPNLPQQLITAIHHMGTRLMGDDGYQRLLAQRLSGHDIGDLVKALGRWYGVTLGESERSSAPSADGGNSSAISNGGTDSTPEGSTSSPATPDSSVPDAPPAS